MKVLVIGSGGREHAILWKLNQSPLIQEIYCTPGNVGTDKIARNVDIDSKDIEKLVEFSREMNIDLTIVGPEEPLVEGIVDRFRQEGLNIIGPTKKAAQLEGSKVFSKKFMRKYNIPTAQYDEVRTLKEAALAIEKYSFPVVVKADGLAAGKGVFICEGKADALGQIKKLLKDKVLGEAGNRIVIEEFLEGIETSILCFVDGNRIVPMVSSQDHKRVLDGDQGPNTGGMGTYSPNYVYTEDMSAIVEREILQPTLEGLQQEQMDYRGILFIGIMITDQGPKVLEYNVRLGDPETQVVIPRLKTDLMEILIHILNKDLKSIDIQWHKESAVCVILSSGGYPESYEKGLEIEGLEDLDEDILLFHSGTDLKNEKIVTNGGRVLSIVALGNTVENAREKVYTNIDKVQFQGMHYRKDIGIK